MKAFPSENDANKEYNWKEPGMDLRDYFAAKVLQGLVSRSGRTFYEEDITYCYELADLMMKARESK